jgi:hypothetical protein
MARTGGDEDSRRPAPHDAAPAFWTTFVLGSLTIPAAIALAHLLKVDFSRHLEATPEAAFIGVGATLPPALTLFWFMLSTWRPVAAFRESQIAFLANLGFRLTPLRIALLSAIAGIGEELLFRGVLQAAADRHMPSLAAILLPNVLFAALHARALVYALAAGAIGVYLGVLFWTSGSLIAAMIAHALYDCIAFEWARRILIQRAPSTD